MFSFFKKKCSICSKKENKKHMRPYLDQQQRKIYVCQLCVSYAERRAYVKAL